MSTYVGVNGVGRTSTSTVSRTYPQAIFESTTVTFNKSVPANSNIKAGDTIIVFNERKDNILPENVYILGITFKCGYINNTTNPLYYISLHGANADVDGNILLTMTENSNGHSSRIYNGSSSSAYFPDYTYNSDRNLIIMPSDSHTQSVPRTKVLESGIPITDSILIGECIGLNYSLIFDAYYTVSAVNGNKSVTLYSDPVSLTLQCIIDYVRFELT